jgi:nucleoside triphosphate pyrophosphatase
LGVSFEVVVPEVEELTAGEPEETVVENARRKARAGMEMGGGEGDLVLGVDTEVVLDGRLLGKAGNEGEARERLEALSGRTHEVLSGVVALVRGTERSGLARSRVTFREVPPDLLAAYLGSGEWEDRAGAYAVQGLGSTLVERVEGDLSNVIGLPVGLLLDLVPELRTTAGDSRS